MGDYDPSGESIFETIAVDVASFVCEDVHGFSPIGMSPAELLAEVSDWFTVERVALTAEQIDEYDLPTAPPKSSDSRSARWDGDTAQAEAMPPDILASTVRSAIESHFDMDALESVLERERDERDRLAEWLEDLSE